MIRRISRVLDKIFLFISHGVEYELLYGMPFCKAWLRGWREHKHEKEQAAQEAAKRVTSCNDEGKCSICKWIETENCYDCFFNEYWEAAKRGEEA